MGAATTAVDRVRVTGSMVPGIVGIDLILKLSLFDDINLPQILFVYHKNSTNLASRPCQATDAALFNLEISDRSGSGKTLSSRKQFQCQFQFQ